MSALRSIHCTGARGAGVRGRSIVYINMHAWFGSRGHGLRPARSASMYNHGCYVRVLYSFMSFGVFKKLTSGTGARMSVRRTMFSQQRQDPPTSTATSRTSRSPGYVGTNRSALVVVDGLEQLHQRRRALRRGDDADRLDVGVQRLRQAVSYIRERKSSAAYANFSEPTGGGRAPGQSPAVQLRSGLGAPSADQAPAGTPTIVSPAVRIDSNGTPHALD